MTKTRRIRTGGIPLTDTPASLARLIDDVRRLEARVAKLEAAPKRGQE